MFITISLFLLFPCFLGNRHIFRPSRLRCVPRRRKVSRPTTQKTQTIKPRHTVPIKTNFSNHSELLFMREPQAPCRTYRRYTPTLKKNQEPYLPAHPLSYSSPSSHV